MELQISQAMSQPKPTTKIQRKHVLAVVAAVLGGFGMVLQQNMARCVLVPKAQAELIGHWLGPSHEYTIYADGWVHHSHTEDAAFSLFEDGKEVITTGHERTDDYVPVHAWSAGSFEGGLLFTKHFLIQAPPHKTADGEHMTIDGVDVKRVP